MAARREDGQECLAAAGAAPGPAVVPAGVVVNGEPPLRAQWGRWLARILWRYPGRVVRRVLEHLMGRILGFIRLLAPGAELAVNGDGADLIGNGDGADIIGNGGGVDRNRINPPRVPRRNYAFQYGSYETPPPRRARPPASLQSSDDDMKIVNEDPLVDEEIEMVDGEPISSADRARYAEYCQVS